MKKLTKWLAAALAVLMLAATLTACGGGGGNSAEIDGPGVSNATTQALEDAWLAKYNSQFNSELDNTLQKQAEDFLQNALRHMDPETREVEYKYRRDMAGTDESGNAIWGEVGCDVEEDGVLYVCTVCAYTEQDMKTKISEKGLYLVRTVGFAVLEYNGLYYWAWAWTEG